MKQFPFTVPLIVAAGALWFGILTTSGATNGFVLPNFRGTANSQAGYWDTFTVPVGVPGKLMVQHINANLEVIDCNRAINPMDDGSDVSDIPHRMTLRDSSPRKPRDNGYTRAVETEMRHADALEEAGLVAGLSAEP